MRFVYGLVVGVLSTLILVAFYIVLTGGEHILAISPKYRSLDDFEKRQEDVVERIGNLERRFTDLSERFTDLTSPGMRSDAPPPSPPAPVRPPSIAR